MRPGGFNTYWKARDRLLLQGATPVDALSTTAIPIGRWVDVEVIGVERHGGHSFVVRDSSGRTHRASWMGRRQPWVGDKGRFRRRLEPGSPTLVRLATEPGFALVEPDGTVSRIEPKAETLRPHVRETFDFELVERGAGIGNAMG